jgi:hypothetical protein
MTPLPVRLAAHHLPDSEHRDGVGVGSTPAGEWALSRPEGVQLLNGWSSVGAERLLEFLDA